MEFQPDLCADMPIVGLVGDSDSTNCSPPSRWRARLRPIRQPGIDRLHLRHDKQPERRRSTAIRRWVSRRVNCCRTTRPTAAASSPQPRLVTSSACWAPSSSRCSKAHRSTCAMCGTPARYSSSSRATGCRSAAGRPTLSPACWTIPTAPRTTWSLHDGRPRWLDGPGGRHPAARRSRHLRLPLLWQHRTPVDHRLRADRAGGQAPLHRRQPAARRGDPTRPTTARSSAAAPICASATPIPR